MKRKIHQIIPADGIYAVNAASETEISFERVACWALVTDEKGEQSVCGMGLSLVLHFCEDHIHFDGYVHESELPEIVAAMQMAQAKAKAMTDQEATNAE